MNPRLNYAKAAPGSFQAMLHFSEYAENSGLETSLIRLVQIRASQINGCAYCLDLNIASGSGQTSSRMSDVQDRKAQLAEVCKISNRIDLGDLALPDRET